MYIININKLINSSLGNPRSERVDETVYKANNHNLKDQSNNIIGK